MNTSEDIPTVEPLEITKGSTVRWNKTISHYKADDGWVLTYAFRGDVVLNVTGVPDGANHSITLSVTETSKLNAGSYWWQSYATKGSERFDVDSGTLQVLVDFAVLLGGSYDGRTHEKKVLDALKATLEGRSTTLDQEVRVNGKQVKFYDMSEILVLYDRFRAYVASQENEERIKNGQGSSSNVFVRFSRG